MAFHTKSEFAALCGQTSGNLTNYITRGKVVMSGEFIDDTEPINQLYLAHRQQLIAKKNEQSGSETADQPAGEIKSSSTVTPQRKSTSPKASSKSLAGAKNVGVVNPNNELTNSTRRKNDASAEKAIMEVKLAQFKYEKELGRYMQIDLVQLIISQLGTTFVASYRSMSETFLTEVAHKARLNAEDFAQLKGVLIKGINTAHELAIKKTKNDMAQAIKKAVIRDENDE